MLNLVDWEFMLNPNLALPILTASKADSTVKRVKPYWLSNNPFTRSSLSWLKGLDRNSYRWLSCIALKRDSSEWATQHTLLQLTARAFYSYLSCRSLNSQLHFAFSHSRLSFTRISIVDSVALGSLQLSGLFTTLKRGPRGSLFLSLSRGKAYSLSESLLGLTR